MATEGSLARYVPQHHCLVVVASRDVRRSLARASFSQMWLAEVPLIFTITTVLSRTERVYDERAERYVHIEVGCAAENLMLQVAALGLGSVAVSAFSDEEVSGVLSLPEGCEPSLIIPVGYPK
jgi:SagB-type dehydrogenase family enzyme